MLVHVRDYVVGHVVEGEVVVHGVLDEELRQDVMSA